MYALSIDLPEKLEGFQRKLGEGVTLLADPDGSAARAWGMLDGAITRSGSFHVDTRGIVKNRWLPTHYHHRPGADAILAALR